MMTFLYEDAKGVMRTRKARKGKQHNGKTKRNKQRSTKHDTEN